MYARVTTVDGNASAIDRGIAFVTDTVQPLVESLPGSLGLNMLTARDLGRVAVVTAWETAEARAASDRELSPIRDEAGRILSGEARTSELEFVIASRTHAQQVGYWARTTRFTGPRDRIDDAIAEFVEEVLPDIRGIDGFCSAVLLVNRDVGTAIAATTWDDRHALAASRPKVAGYREATAKRSHATVDEIVESQLVIAGLHDALWHPIPRQADRVIELRRSSRSSRPAARGRSPRGSR